ncbi:MAG: hypothetical protein QF793_04305, partial [Candidatus Peribacteraceae bacterium]|nr:hypothetical protein [Candidatus Peribacteraceae bacterium]
MTPDHSSSVADNYYKKFAGTNFVTKASGTLIEKRNTFQGVLRAQQTFMRHDIRCVLVHGGGKQLSRALKDSTMHPETHLRITPKEAIPTLERELVEISNTIASECVKLNIPHIVLPHSITRATRRLGHGETGEVSAVKAWQIINEANCRRLVIVPFGGVEGKMDEDDGATLNVNADEVAWRTAASIEASKLIFLTNEEGIMVPGKNGKKVRKSFLDIHNLLLLLRKKTLSGRFVIAEGMVPKVEACIQALAHGVKQVHMLKPSLEAILAEVLTHTGSGTLIEKKHPIELVFPATEKHYNDIMQLREECSSHTTPSGVPLLKPLSGLGLRYVLNKTLVLEHRGTVVGTIYIHHLQGRPNIAMLGGF